MFGVSPALLAAIFVTGLTLAHSAITFGRRHGLPGFHSL